MADAKKTTKTTTKAAKSTKAVEVKTIEQLNEVFDVAPPRFKTWKLRKCSICHSEIGYVFHEGNIAYDGRCDCNRLGDIRPVTRNDLLKTL